MKFSRAFAIVLRLYPAEHRRLLGAEMCCVFEQAAQQQRNRGRAAYAGFLLREGLALLKGAAVAWNAQWSGRYLPEYGIEAVPEQGAGNTAEAALPCEVLEAQQRADLLVSRIVHAIAHHDFTNARLYSEREREAREHLRRVRRQYRICD